LDESGFMLQPVVRRTWAPRGCTPIQYSWDRHDRLSAISAVTVSPRRRRLGLYFALHEHNIRTPEVEAFAADLLVHLPHGLILVLDRSQPHRSAAPRLKKRFPRRLRIEWLPPYAPDLNPDEQVWTRTKYADLANFIPEDVTDLRQAVHDSLLRTGTQQSLLRSFFKHAKLKL
jgi:transposase